MRRRKSTKRRSRGRSGQLRARKNGIKTSRRPRRGGFRL